MTVDRYETLAKACHSEIPKIKGSRFIADGFPVSSAEDAEEKIAQVRRLYHDASHHCFAYRLGVSGDVHRASDDGEPSGSAGAPILRQIEGAGLSDVVVVVTRYFGGTKLGTGGLVRAYSEAAAALLGEAKRRTRRLYSEVDIRFAYDDTAPAMRLIEQWEARIVSSQYGEDTRLTVAVPRSKTEAFLDDFVEALGGRGTAHRS